MKELYEKIFYPAFMNLQLGWFKEILLRDCMELESTLNMFKLKYGLELEIKVNVPEPIEGRFLGNGIVQKLEELSSTPLTPEREGGGNQTVK